MRARAAAAGFPSQTITEEQFKEMQEQSVRGFGGCQASSTLRMHCNAWRFGRAEQTCTECQEGTVLRMLHGAPCRGPQHFTALAAPC